MQQPFEIVGTISECENIAVGNRIRELPRLVKAYGPGRWLKRKGVAVVRLESGATLRAEVHWYEAHGIGKKELKIKRLLS